MAIDYKKLLPVVLRNTRWGQFAEAFQSLVATFKEEKLDIIKDRFNYELATIDELKDIATALGYTLSIYDGYTSTLNYLQKQIETIVPRIQNRIIPKGYLYIFYIYNLYGYIYPVLTDNLGNFYVKDTYYTEESLTYSSIYLDFTPSITIDSLDFVALDSSYGLGYKWTRNFIIQFTPKFIEAETYYLSDNTLRAFGNDVEFSKRITERPYFEHLLNIETFDEYFQYETVLTSYDGTITANKEIYISDAFDFRNITSIRFGTSFVPVDEISYGILPADVQSFSYAFDISTDVDTIIDTSELKMYIRKKISENQTLSGYNFSELALMEGSTMRLYSSFPEIRFNPLLKNNIALNFSVSIISC